MSPRSRNFGKVSPCIVTSVIYLLLSLASEGNSFDLSIVHFSDFHARYIPVSPSGGLCYDYERDKCVGGVARVAAIAKHLKRIRSNAILLNAGDCFQGTLYYDVHRGNITAYFMDKLPHDAMTIGNHDFDDNVLGLKCYVEKLNMPVVATNVDSSREPSIKNLFLNSTVIRRGDRDIGVIGVIYNQTDKISSTTGKVKFLNEIETVNLEAARLKSKGIDIIIVLSHCGIEHDKAMANNCPDVDVIVGGHSHILLYNGEPPSGDEAYDEYPIVVEQRANDRKVLIVHAGAFTKYMGDLRLVFDERGEAHHWEGNPIYLNSTVEEDPAILEELGPWKIEVDRIGKRLIGKTVVFLNGSCSSGECNLANLVTDAMVDLYKHNGSVSFISANSLQNSIPVGPILYEDLYMTLPYNNTWNLIELKGRDLLQVLEDNVVGSSSNVTFANDKLLLWSGLKVVYNLTNERSKVVDAKVRCLDCEKNEFEKLNVDTRYRVVVPDYLLTEEFKTIHEKYRLLVTGKTRDIDNTVAYVRQIRVVNARKEARMVFV